MIVSICLNYKQIGQTPLDLGFERLRRNKPNAYDVYILLIRHNIKVPSHILNMVREKIRSVMKIYLLIMIMLVINPRLTKPFL